MMGRAQPAGAGRAEWRQAAENGGSCAGGGGFIRSETFVSGQKT